MPGVQMPGVGYFIGAACITFNYYFALGVLLFLILLAMPWAVTGEFLVNVVTPHCCVPEAQLVAIALSTQAQMPV
jgi:hypothetical protein